MEHTQIKVGDTFHRPFQTIELKPADEMTWGDLKDIEDSIITPTGVKVQTQEQADRINAGEDVESVLKSITPEDLASTNE